jgi:hypothetical protein
MDERSLSSVDAQALAEQRPDTGARDNAGGWVGLITLLWITVVPVLGIMGFFRSLNFGGTEPRADGRWMLNTAVVLLVALPALATGVALWGNRPVLAAFYGVITAAIVVLGLVSAMADQGNRPDQGNAPDRGNSRGCVTMSGGTNTCPGG